MSTLVLPNEVAVTAKEQAQWMLHRLVPGRGICNIGVAVRADQQLRWWPLQQALNHLLRRHPALRTVLRVDGTAVRKRFLDPTVSFPLTTEAATEETLADTLTDLVAPPFDIETGPLARAHLVILPGASVVCMVFHHLVADYTSATVLLGELPRLYDGFAATGQVPDELDGAAAVHFEPPPDRATVDYWVRRLEGVDAAGMALADARPIPGRPTFAGARLEHQLSEASFAALDRIQRGARLTQNMVLLAAFYLLLARHGAGPDLVVGIPVNGRRGARADVVGYHANTLPIRVNVDDSADLRTLLSQTCDAFLGGMEHDTASFEAVQGELAVRSGDWRVPLFRHMFNYRPHVVHDLRIADTPLRIVEVHHAMSRLDLEWIVWGGSTSVEVSAVYSTEVHEGAFVSTLLERYDAILVEMAEALDGPVRAVSAYTEADRAAVRRLNETDRELPGRTLLEEIRARAVAQPDRPAVRDTDGPVTYRQLFAAAERVRRTLAGNGLRAGETVALCARRGAELAAAVLGVWAAGAAYLPLDPAHPARRLADHLDDAGVRLVLADTDQGIDQDTDPDTDPGNDPDVDPGIDREGRTGRQWLPLGAIAGLDQPAVDAGPEPGPGSWPAPDPAAVAYLIYTSGSTGRPKGVEISHRSLANLVRDFVTRLSAGPADRTLWLTTLSFDISALELLLPLATGGELVVASDQDRLDPHRLLDLVVREDVTILQATPTTWRHVSAQLRGQLHGRRVLCGGEPLSAELAGRLLEQGCRLFNVYGPTETTIWSTVAELSAPVAEPVPIGEPLANTTVHVLGPGGRPVPPGMPGELGIGGAGVAVGYRGRPELTAERFPADPQIGRHYRTGDLVRLTGAGLVFLGRLDRQVKVRGHRLELAEVEAVLERHPAVRAAAVVPEPDGAGHLRLVAAVQPAGPDQPAADELRSFAAERLPEAALPSRYVVVPELPVTGNQKIDHRALAERVRRLRGPAPLPADPLLRTLVTLWRQMLGDDRLGADANFFLHGGHSLLAATLAERVAAELGVPVDFEAIFDAPSPERMVAWLAERKGPAARAENAGVEVSRA